MISWKLLEHFETYHTTKKSKQLHFYNQKVYSFK